MSINRKPLCQGATAIPADAVLKDYGDVQEVCSECGAPVGEYRSGMNTMNKLREQLREGSEARHYADRKTPDGKEHVEMIPIEWAVEVVQSEISRIESIMQDYAIEARKPLEKMLDSLGVEKCPICSEHLIDDDMNICEACNYGVHEWCTGYTYDGEGEYPAESAYAICKNCYKPEQLRTTNQTLKGEE